MEMKARTRLAYVLGGLVVLVAAGFVIYAFNPRFTEIVGEVQEFLHGGPRDTSIGIRMQLWEASLHLFRQHPWVGIGFSNFHQALHNLVDQGLITDYVEAHFGEPHNDLVAAMVGYGTLGLLAMTALYWLPALWFYRRMGSLSPRVRVAARVGLLLCLGYPAFSLTEMMFRNMRSVPIYSTLLVILVSLAREPEPREESPGERPEAAKL
jgi:O-antigen ligase